LVSGPTRAAAFVLNGDGTFRYTPELGFTCTDSFTYRAVGALRAVSDVVAVTITVNPVDPVPGVALIGDVLFIMGANTNDRVAVKLLGPTTPGVRVQGQINGASIDKTFERRN
jgi:hypothetical protein